MTLAEVYQFIEALNVWLRTEQKTALLTLGKGLTFARLPTEVEWEFAARGGIKVLESGEPGRFDRHHPYDNDKLLQHEWCNKNTRGILMETSDVAQTKPKRLPNPLGLYDMLGNVEELTLSLFGPDYLQGRLGGYVVRGANYSSSPSDLTAYKRGEYLWLGSSSGRPMRSSTLGIRLVLASRISGTLPGPELNEAYENYLESGGLTLSRPAPVHSSSPAFQAEEDQLNQLKEHARQLAVGKSALE